MKLCQYLGVTRGGYYAWKSRPASRRDVMNKCIVKEMKRIHRRVKETYGSPRMVVELNERGYQCCVNTVAKLMKNNGIRAKMDRRHKPRQWKANSLIKKGNLLEAIDGPTLPNQIWVADFTYVKIGSRFVYLSVIMDLYTRMIVGMAMSRERNSELIVRSLNSALKRSGGVCPEIFHSDRGIEYANYRVGDILQRLGINQSMSGKGNCYDNAHMESFFHTYKSELYYVEPFVDYSEFRRKTMSYVRFYNEQRLHSSLGYKSPANFERQAILSVNF